MAGTPSIQAELKVMRDELSPGTGADAGHAGAPIEATPNNPCGAELESVLREIQAKLGEASESADELIKAHPVAALASALLVGIAIGCLMGRR